MNQSTYTEWLTKRLQWAFGVAKEVIDKDIVRRKLYYDCKFYCMKLIPGDVVLSLKRYLAKPTK